MNQTAVEYLFEQIIQLNSDMKYSVINWETYLSKRAELLEQSKQMEKEQRHESVNAQVNILKDTLDDMMTGFDSEEDRIDFILDICNGYRKRIKSE